ncbi:MAG: hypothetical protein MRY83_17785 [Flavobacteriales bacterium]|nr:hypothetical protein [Flavobacteriales bacterium]
MKKTKNRNKRLLILGLLFLIGLAIGYPILENTSTNQNLGSSITIRSFKKQIVEPQIDKDKSTNETKPHVIPNVLEPKSCCQPKSENIKDMKAINVDLGNCVQEMLDKRKLVPLPKENSQSSQYSCVFNDIFGFTKIDKSFLHVPDESIEKSIEKALVWITDMQNSDGGWSAGNFTHYEANTDTSLLKSDLATTSMVSMALLRNGSDLITGDYSSHLNRSLEFVLVNINDGMLSRVDSVTTSYPIGNGKFQTVTTPKQTQIQMKLGQHIDAVITAQFLSNLIPVVADGNQKSRIKSSLEKCVDVVQTNVSHLGVIEGGTWAAEIQNSLGANALSSATKYANNIDKSKLEKLCQGRISALKPRSANRQFAGTGILLYSVSGGLKVTSKYVRMVEKSLACAQSQKLIHKNAEVDKDLLVKVGYSEKRAQFLSDTYHSYHKAQELSMDKKVQIGFGNDGGEEYISFLQSGEGMIMAKDEKWHDWYDSIASRLLRQQNKDGSWNGSHCISSPVFCTATSLLVLGINNDVETLLAMN